MLKNNNQPAVRRIAARSMQKNRIRNLFAVLAVVLTTLMLTSVFTILLSLGKNMNTMQLRMQGTCASVYLSAPTEEQRTAAENCAGVNAVGAYIELGSFTVADAEDDPVRLRYCDEAEYKQNLLPALGAVTGEYPEAPDAVMLPTSALELLGIDAPEMGMQVTLPLSDDAGKPQTFTLSGWYRDYGPSAAFCSAQYAQEQGKKIEQDGILSVSCKLGKQNEVYAALNDLPRTQSQTLEATFDVQSENSTNLLVIAVAILLISLIVVLSGYLLIYNVLYISVTKDIRFYGMLKTVGTSPSQLRTIVRRQAFRFLIVGVPVGILLGTLISFVGAPLATNMFSGGGRDDGVMPTGISFEPIIYIGTILFSILTVALGCRKPAKIASSISPVEALHYHGVKGGTKQKARKSAHGGRPLRMAIRNVFREKKRAFLVFASLFMGTMAFLTVNTFIGCLKLDNFVDAYLPNDYALYLTNPDQDDAAYNKAADRLVEQMQKLGGLEYVDVSRTVCAELDENDELYRPFYDYFLERIGKIDKSALDASIEEKTQDHTTNVISVSARMMEEYNKRARKPIDIDAFQKGKAALIGPVSKEGDGDAMLGKTMTLTNPENGKAVSLSIGAVSSGENSYGLNTGGRYYFPSVMPHYVLVCDSVIDQLSDTPSISTILADCKEGKEGCADEAVKNLAENNRYVEAYDIKNLEAADFRTSMSSLNVLSSGISMVLILIGVLNFINVMLTGVHTRRRELAVLESIGMTKKQIRKMLMWEGLDYALITIGLILTAGTGLMYLSANLAVQIADYAVFSYPWKLMLLIAASILAVCILVPVLVYRTASKETVTERLRIAE